VSANDDRKALLSLFLIRDSAGDMFSINSIYPDGQGNCRAPLAVPDLARGCMHGTARGTAGRQKLPGKVSSGMDIAD